MPFTDHSDIYAAVHEKGINTVVRHLMRQRPSLFNYATPFFHQYPKLFCNPIEAAPTVLQAGNPLFTEVEPLPIYGAPIPIGVNFCLQLTDAEIDFHPGNIVRLPAELGKLASQHLAIRLKACVGLDCPPTEWIERMLPAIERLLVEQQKLAIGEVKEQTGSPRLSTGAVSDRGAAELAGPEARELFNSRSIVIRDDLGKLSVPARGIVVLPTRELTCFCLELFAVAHFEWGSVPGSTQPWLKTRLDGLEIVDLAPTPMENAIECYLSTVLRLGILPQVIVPMEKLIFDVTSVLEEQGLSVSQSITLQPAEVPADVPDNPAIEQDELRAFVRLKITGGS